MIRWIAASALVAAALAGCRGGASIPATPPSGLTAAVATPTATAATPTAAAAVAASTAATVPSATAAASTAAAAPSAAAAASIAAPTSAAGCAPARPRAAGDTIETIASGGLDRTYIVHVPTGYAGTALAPVVLLFHGYGLSAEYMRTYTRFSDVADAHQFILIIPDGSGSPQYWNTTGVPGGPDDAAFVHELIAKVGAELCVDPRRVYAAGYSNGGGISQLLACELPGEIAAVGLVASEYLPCKANAPLIAFHGTADPLVPYGDVDATGADRSPSVSTIAASWAAGLGCDDMPAISRPASDLELSTFSHCRSGHADVLLYTVLGGGHTWPGAAFSNEAVGPTTQEINASTTMWDFFAARTSAP